MDKIKQNIDLQEAIQRYNIEKSVVGTLAYNIDQNLQKGMSVDEAIENVLNKSEGEGSRGGKVIGHTKSGKPIYEGGEHHKLMQSSFNLRPEEHLRTAKILRQKAAKIKAGLKDGASANVTLRELERRAKIHEDVYAMRTQKSFEDTLQKSKSMPIGTIHNGFKKIAEGKWRKVSKQKMTKEEHEDESKNKRVIAWNTKDDEYRKKFSDESKLNEEAASKLDSRDYSDEEVTGGEGKDKNSERKSLEQERKVNRQSYENKEIDYDTYSHNERKIDRKFDKVFKKSFPEPTLSKSEQTEAQKAKVKKVMDEWKAGKLKSSSGEKVVSQSQALAIAMSEVGIEMKKSGDSDIEKGGEGSRGGKIIGHTKSGKPIYESTEVEHDHGIKVGHEVQHEGRTKKVTDVRGNILYFGNNDYVHVSKVYKKDGSSYV